MISRSSLSLILLLLAATAAGAEAQHEHARATHAEHVAAPAAAQPSHPGQAAFGALAEVVRLLDADPATDWTRVDLERLRRHLADMDAVTLRARVEQAPVEGGFEAHVTGEGEVAAAIRRMVPAHAAQLRAEGYGAEARETGDGVLLRVTAGPGADAARVARLRGLGFIGTLTLGGHHGPHHLAMARGAAHH